MSEPNYAEEMKLPDGKMCNDCRHFKRCRSFFDCDGSKSCDFWPNVFTPNKDQPND